MKMIEIMIEIMIQHVSVNSFSKDILQEGTALLY